MTAEDKLQSECVKWFRYQYPELKKLLFAVPNGANLTDTQRMLFAQTGMMPGVADLILLIQKLGYGSLCIEMKTRKGDIYNITGVNRIVKKNGLQKIEQHEWELSAISHGNKYVICRTFDEFKREIEAYLN